MSIHKLLNNLRMHASIANNNKTFPSIGAITGFDPDNWLVTVEIHPATDDSPALQTGWIPLTSHWVGNEWGLFLAPNIGDIVGIHYQEGSLQNAYAASLFFNDQRRPVPVPSGEAWLLHGSGSFIKLQNDGTLSINGDTEINLNGPEINITASTTVNVNAPAVNIGDTNGTLQKLLMDSARTIFNEHTHNEGAVPAPDQKMDATVSTGHTKAN